MRTGRWGADPTYGNVWFPTRVAADWAPYRDGHWAWVDPWGWTWVDDAPGALPSPTTAAGRTCAADGAGYPDRFAHVRTMRRHSSRSWVATTSSCRSRPATSAASDGSRSDRAKSTDRVLVSRRYFENVNVSNTVVNTTVINNYYNNTNVTNVNYVNRQVPGAVVAVPTTAFVQSQQVARSAVRVTPQMVADAPVTTAAAVVPTERSVRGAAAQGDKPPARVFERPVVARTAPAPAQASFAAQQQQLETRQGKPLDDAARKQIQAAPAAPAPTVKVVAQPRAAPPTATLPAGLAGQDTRTRSTPAPANAGAPSSAGARRSAKAPRPRKSRNPVLHLSLAGASGARQGAAARTPTRCAAHSSRARRHAAPPAQSCSRKHRRPRLRRRRRASCDALTTRGKGQQRAKDEQRTAA